MPRGLFNRKKQVDRGQRVRYIVQASFLLLNCWIGIQFYYFVRYFEQGGVKVSRPPGVEGWLPIAGMMNTSYFLQTGRIPAIHPAAMVLFVTFIGISLVFRKSFCGWICPIGTISEQFWKAGRQAFGKSFFPPRWLDIVLRGLKYVLLALFIWAAGMMTASGIEAFLAQPYGLLADVKMFDFFRHMTPRAGAVIGLLAVGSFFVPNLWCRYLCPYGALMGFAALASPLRIRRVSELCIDCGKCARACPAKLPVDQLVQVRSAECIGCMECVATCPAEGALLFATRRRRMNPYAMGAVVAIVFIGAVSVARLTGHWQSPIADSVYQRLIPEVGDLNHP